MMLNGLKVVFDTLHSVKVELCGVSLSITDERIRTEQQAPPVRLVSNR